jgi:FAD/FMN-containing dehydrogenase/Fe-S oxidoreductase
MAEATKKIPINERPGEGQQDDLRLMDALIDGDLFTDTPRRLMYATDASAYRELPLSVCRPRHEADIIELVKFASARDITLIPRAAGTSLAGQVVGRGIVVDSSRYMTAILEIDHEKRLARVQPGVIPDELNGQLRPYGLFFSPETSTSNRCMIGGMIGNNSSGLHSLVYGSTREHLESVRMVLSDGSIVTFGPVDQEAFEAKCGLDTLEGAVYRNARELFSDPVNLDAIHAEFPEPDVVRRNTGYALDELAATRFMDPERGRHETFNFCRLIAGSEGTLGFITEAVLRLDPLPPPVTALVPVHLDSVMEAIRANLVALRHGPTAVELMDRTILELTEKNITQRKNRFFLKGTPGAVLIVEFAGPDLESIRDRAASMEQAMRTSGLGYHFPLVTGSDISRVWALRKAGLGVLSRMEGDAKPVSVIEDTSVVPDKLEPYITEFDALLERYGLQCVYHAHISVGELHLRPVLNLRDPGDVELFHTLAEETARLVKKYHGSLSGEHGDGRLRGEFIPLMLGERNFAMVRSVKEAWDPDGVFNRNKIIDTPPMNTFLRVEPGQKAPAVDTVFDFGEGGILRHIEQCNGSGDCRKTVHAGGTMCPSYMAAQEEWTTTRARANILREFIGKNGGKNPFDHPEIFEVLDLCLSCKACKSECPSSVDMAKLKSEFLQHWHDAHGIPLRTRLIAHITSINRLGSLLPGLFNSLVKNRVISGMLKSLIGIARERTIPALHSTSFRKWAARHLAALNGSLPEEAPEVVYYVDEFTNYNDTPIAITTVRLLNRLGFKVLLVRHALSGRTFFSKGLVRRARKHARRNVEILSKLVTDDRLLVGTEPSAILGFRDEYPELVGPDLNDAATFLSERALLFEEFFMKQVDEGRITASMFTDKEQSLRFHGHCQQKAVASTRESIEMLSFPTGYTVREIPSGCCGMAGSFGYEKEHYALSMKVGELVLFPAVRSAENDTIIVASGTSCRHQIADGTGVKAKHPVEVIYEALD